MPKFTVDEVYDIIGHFGFSQSIYCLSLALLHFFSCHHMLLNIFAGLEMDFSCQVEGKSEHILENQCPDNMAEKCEVLKFNSTFHSIAEEWGLVCNRKYKLPLVQSAWMGGVLAGALFLGGMADRFGRLSTIMISILGTIVFEGFSAFAPSYALHISLRFLGGMSCALVILVSFVLAQELVGGTRRSLCSLISSITFSVGIGAMTLMAAVVSYWRSLVFYSSIMGICFISLFWLVPESPRWLLSKGRVEKAQGTLIDMAHINGTGHLLPEKWELASPNEGGKSQKKGALKDLFSHCYVLKLTLIQIYSWFVTSISYYALTMAATSLGGDIYVSTTINGLVEVPAAIVGLMIIDKYGRRLCISMSLILTGVFCLAIPILAIIWPSSVNTFALLGKLCISDTFSFIYIYSGEVFPTVVRNTAIGVVSVGARVGGIVSPFILTLKDILPNLEFLVIGILTLIAGLASLMLPETLGRPMPETLQDMINMKNDSVSEHFEQNGYAKLIDQELNPDFMEEDSEIEIKGGFST